MKCRAGTVAALFAGIGGIEAGLARSGFEAEFFSEVDPRSQAVLRSRFASVEIAGDIRKVRALPAVDLVTAGFPCQDLSVAGRRAGIEGARSSLVQHLMR